MAAIPGGIRRSFWENRPDRFGVELEFMFASLPSKLGNVDSGMVLEGVTEGVTEDVIEGVIDSEL